MTADLKHTTRGILVASPSMIREGGIAVVVIVVERVPHEKSGNVRYPTIMQYIAAATSNLILMFEMPAYTPNREKMLSPYIRSIDPSIDRAIDQNEIHTHIHI